MAEPTIALQLNEGTEGTPTWAAIDTAARFTGPDAADGALTDPLPAPVGDGDEVFFDDAASPNDGELWNEKAGTDTKTVGQGRNTNQKVLRALETGAADATADPPELTAYDDATDAGNRTAPTTWFLIGTTGSSSIGLLRAHETTSGAPGGDWATQVHDAAPTGGSVLEGDVTKEACATVLAASGSKEFNLAAAVPHDATSGLTSFVLALQYTYT